MPKLNGTGPEGRGAQTGRRLGKCSGKTDEEKFALLGKGQAKRRNTENGPSGRMRIINKYKQNNDE